MAPLPTWPPPTLPQEQLPVLFKPWCLHPRPGMNNSNNGCFDDYRKKKSNEGLAQASPPVALSLGWAAVPVSRDP